MKHSTFNIQHRMGKAFAALVVFVVLLASAEAQPLPVVTEPTYSLRWLAWDHPGGANITYRVLVGTNSGEWQRTINTGTNRLAAVPGLRYDTTYFFAVMAATPLTNSVASSVLRWPWPVTNYFRPVNQWAAAVNGPWVDVPYGTVIISTNERGYFRLSGSQSNNLSAHQQPE